MQVVSSESTTKGGSIFPPQCPKKPSLVRDAIPKKSSRPYLFLPIPISPLSIQYTVGLFYIMHSHIRRRFWLYLRLVILITLALSSLPSLEADFATSQTIDFRKDYLWLGAVIFFIGFPMILFFWLRSSRHKPDYSFRSLVLFTPLGVTGKYAFSTWAFLSLLALLMGIFDIPYAASSGQWMSTLLTIVMGAAFATATFLAYFSTRQLAQQDAAANP